MNIAIIIIFSKEQTAYPEMKKILENYYSKFTNIKYYFTQYRVQNNDLEIENNDIFVNGKETRLGITKKTLIAMNHVKNDNCDFLIRTNISTVIDIKSLMLFLKAIPNKNIYCGGLYNRLGWRPPGIEDDRYLGLAFVGGTSIIMSNDICSSFCNNLEKFNHALVDDVSFGLFIKDNHPDVLIETDNFTKPNAAIKLVNNLNINSLIKNLPNNNIVFYRNNNVGRKIDVEHMKIICDSIINLKHNI